MDDITFHATQAMRETQRPCDADSLAEALVGRWSPYEGRSTQIRDVARLLRQERQRTLADIERWLQTTQASLEAQGRQIEASIRKGEMADINENWKKKRCLLRRAKFARYLSQVVKEFRRRDG